MRFRLLALAALLAALLAANGPALLPGFTPTLALAQQKQALILEDIWTKPISHAASVPGSNWMSHGIRGGNTSRHLYRQMTNFVL